MRRLILSLMLALILASSSLADEYMTEWFYAGADAPLPGAIFTATMRASFR